MVNETVLSYLKDNYPTYDLDTLKKEILSGGYTEEEFNEAVKALNLNKTPVKTEPIQQIISPPESSTKPSTEPKKEVVQTNPVVNVPTSPKTTQNSTITATESNSQPTTTTTAPGATTPATNNNFLFKQEPAKTVNPPLSTQTKENELPSKGTPWIKIAGVIGFILLLLNISFFGINIYSSTKTPSLLQTSSTFQFLIFFILFVSMILGIFYFSGFIKLGRLVESKILKFSSWSFIVLLILGILSLIILFLIALTTGDSLITANAISSIDNPEQEVVLGQMSPLSGLSDSMGVMFYVISGISLLLLLFIFINFILFFVGLIKSGKQIKYAKSSGILGIILLILTSLFILSLPLLLIIMVFSGQIIMYFMLGANISFMIAGLVQLSLMNLALFDASKKFESK